MCSMNISVEIFESPEAPSSSNMPFSGRSSRVLSRQSPFRSLVVFHSDFISIVMASKQNKTKCDNKTFGEHFLYLRHLVVN